jgi:hypothetical protein
VWGANRLEEILGTYRSNAVFGPCFDPDLNKSNETIGKVVTLTGYLIILRNS